MTDSPSIVLFQTDLRLSDNPALSAAARRGKPLLCLYVWNDEYDKSEQPGAASRWWLHHSLQSLAADLRKAGNDLLIRTGRAPAVLSELLDDFKNSHIFWNRCCEPSARTSEDAITNLLIDRNIQGTCFHGTVLIDPSLLLNQADEPYRVFTPFWKRLQSSVRVGTPLPAPKRLPSLPSTTPVSETLESLELLPQIDWAEGIRKSWNPGENGAQSALKTYIKKRARSYAAGRDRPDLPHTSRLSPHLHFGEIGPAQIWRHLSAARQKSTDSLEKKSLDAYLRQVGWREFARYLLYHFPHTAREPLYGNYRSFPWGNEVNSLRAWQKGRTGYPIVDAGMRELWHTGWMHNRVRMITASFLTKDLLISWKKGAEWFWDTLVDADLANNTLGWQWVAGCGADASPFFRIFNPVTQGLKFDPHGRYVAQWVPELAGLPPRWIHQPWEAPARVLAEADVRLGETYPLPIVNHLEARDRALGIYKKFQRKKSLRNRQVRLRTIKGGP